MIARWMSVALVALLVARGIGAGAAAAQESAAPVSRVPASRHDVPSTSTGDLIFYLDAASFQGAESLTRVEAYVLMDAKQLQFVRDGDRHVSHVDLTLALTDSSGEKVSERSWSRNVGVSSLRELREASAPFRDVGIAHVSPGRYRVTLEVEDVYGDKRGTAHSRATAADYSGASLVASDLVVASEMQPSASKGRFSRGGWDVIPNATRRCLLGAPLRVYSELYNLSEAGPDARGFVMGYSLTDTAGVAVSAQEAKRFRKPGQSCVKPDSLSTEGIPAGTYYVQVEAFDLDSRQHAKSRRMIWLVALGGERQLTQDERDQLRYYADIRYIASDSDLRVFEGLQEGSEERMGFLRSFWKRLDPTPETPTNERVIEHMRRLRFAENNFSGRPGKRGSDTAKGRVYVKYGPPDDREYRTSIESAKPVEIWTYERYEFIFRDSQGLGVYELVHATYPGELNNPNWEDEP